MGKHVESGAHHGGFRVEPHVNDIGVTCKRGLGCCSEHGDHGRVQIVAFDENAIREVNEERGDEGQVKVLGSKCNKIINGHASKLGISIFGIHIVKANGRQYYLLTNVERALKLSLSRMRAPHDIKMTVLSFSRIKDAKAGGNIVCMNYC